MKDSMDILLKNALEPNRSPSLELNQKILAISEDRNIDRGVVRNKVTSMNKVTSINKIIEKVFVSEHAISVGNSDYVDDAAIAEEETATVQNKSHEEGDDSVNWISKDIEVVNGFATNTYYQYKDYTTAIIDAQFDNWFNTCYENPASATYVTTETEDTLEKSVNARYYYNDGSFFVSQNTFVMIAYDEYYGYISFEYLSEEEIYQILDTLSLL